MRLNLCCIETCVVLIKHAFFFWDYLFCPQDIMDISSLRILWRSWWNCNIFTKFASIRQVWNPCLKLCSVLVHFRHLSPSLTNLIPVVTFPWWWCFLPCRHHAMTSIISVLSNLFSSPYEICARVSFSSLKSHLISFVVVTLHSRVQMRKHLA